MLFFICLNFGLGIAHIPDTPLSIPDSQKATTGECLNDFYTQGLLTRVPATGVDANGNFAYVMSTYTSGSNNGQPILPNFNSTATEIHGGSVDGVFNVYDNILEPIDTLNAGVDTFINVMFGGYITNILDTMTLECDTRQFTDPEETQPNPNISEITIPANSNGAGVFWQSFTSPANAKMYKFAFVPYGSGQFSATVKIFEGNGDNIDGNQVYGSWIPWEGC